MTDVMFPGARLHYRDGMNTPNVLSAELVPHMMKEEQNLHRHIHVENNVLFPKALHELAYA